VVGMKDLTDSEYDRSKKISQSKSNEDDSALTEAAWTIAQALGVRIDTCQRVVDTYGADHVLAALADVQKQVDAGKQLRSPIAVMIANLKSGAVQVEVAQVENPDVEWLHQRYHNQQAAADIETAAKNLARRANGFVQCACGQVWGNKCR
jgi:hypothetical protein